MIDPIDQERAKWNENYASLSSYQEDYLVHQFNEEFVSKVCGLLPEGGKTLEAGCGAGWQSLALAKTGKFQVELLDFSTQALDYAGHLFTANGLPARFILEDAMQPGEPEYDLVFNAGVLEHYPFDQQVRLLRSMASKSKRYVLVLVPNLLCYWYWLWRVQKTSLFEWSFGKEIPFLNLNAIFESAGIKLAGYAYLGKKWTESFIQNLNGLDEALKQEINLIHRSGVIPEPQTSYLVAALGVVGDTAINPPGWDTQGMNEMKLLPDLHAALADLTAANLQALNKTETLRNKIENLQVELASIKENNVFLSQSLKDLNLQKELAESTLQALQLQKQALEIALESQKQQAEAALELQKRQTEAALELQKHQAEAALELQKHQAEAALELQKRQAEADLEMQKRQAEATLEEQKQQADAALELQKRQGEAALRWIHQSESWKIASWIIKILDSIKSLSFIKSPIRKARSFFKSPRTQIKKLLSTIRHRLVRPTPLGVQGGTDVTLAGLDADVLIITHRFFDFDGNNMFFGGAERYVIELVDTIRELGYDAVVLQCGNSHWVRFFKDIKVVGINTRGDVAQFNRAIEKLNLHAKLAIYSPFSIATNRLGFPTIGISHGVFWDHPTFQTLAAQNAVMNPIITALQIVDKLVSVDTNTINWIRATVHFISQKSTYIPNFVDTQVFCPASKEQDQKIVILFPRRLYRPRGFHLILELVPELLARYPQVEFHFIGKADPEDEEKVKKFVNMYPERVKWCFLPMERMSEAYQQADITIIPTLHSEGTSLSCLEAMACGNAVIATNVGGLADLIIPGFNGLLIEPNAVSLKAALEQLIEDKELRSNLGHNGRKVAEQFTVEKWENKWKQVLAEYLPLRQKFSPPESKSVIFPYAWGIFWEGVKQRPHHIAVQFANNGMDVYWYDPKGRNPDPQPNLHLIGKNDDLYMSHPVLFIFYPHSYEDIGKFSNPIVVYDILDDISIHDVPDNDQAGQIARDYHRRLIERADIVLASSQILLDQVKKIRPDVIYTPNGVDLDHFDPDKVTPTTLLNDLKKPIIGYHGAIASWFDGELLAMVARLRPEYDFVLIGPVSDEKVSQQIASRANIHALGTLPYEELPPYVTRFDVGIMPFVVSQLTNAVRPLKVLEYLAMRKPVVATPMLELTDWPGVILASSAEEFARAIDHCLAQGKITHNTPEVMELLRQSTWIEVTKPLLKAIEDKINQSGCMTH